MIIGRLNSRNSIPGTITHIKIEPVSAEVTINIAGDVGIVSVIVTASAEELKLKDGSRAFAVTKVSSVMVGVDHA